MTQSGSASIQGEWSENVSIKIAIKIARAWGGNARRLLLRSAEMYFFLANYRRADKRTARARPRETFLERNSSRLKITIMIIILLNTRPFQKVPFYLHTLSLRSEHIH